MNPVHILPIHFERSITLPAHLCIAPSASSLFQGFW